MTNHDINNLAAMALSFYDVIDYTGYEAVAKYAENHEYNMACEAELALWRYKECRECFIKFMDAGYNIHELRELVYLEPKK